MESGKREIGGTLPDGTEIELQGEIFKCPEALFQPNKMNKESVGIHEAIYQSIINCDQQIKKDLYGGILLAGGCTMFKGKFLISLNRKDLIRDYLKKLVLWLLLQWLLKLKPLRKENFQLGLVDLF